MKGIIAGDWKWNIYENALQEGFVKLGHKVDSFKIELNPTQFSSKIQYKLRTGSIINKINGKKRERQ